MAKVGDITTKKVLKDCCGLVYMELERLGQEPAREALVRNDEAISELIELVRETWVDEFGGDPSRFPWNKGFVLDQYIAFRKQTRKSKDNWTPPPFFFSADKEIGTVYFIENRLGRIKIGWTGGDVQKRIKELQTGDSDGLTLLFAMPGSVATERRLHFNFANSRVRSNGEWFFRSQEILNFIKQQKDASDECQSPGS